jgi:cell division protease FtsH
MFGNNNKIFFVIWVLIMLLLAISYNFVQDSGFSSDSKEIDFSEFTTKVESGEVSEVTKSGQNVEGTLKSGQKFTTRIIDYPELWNMMQNKGVHIKVKPVDNSMNTFLSILISWLPMLLLIGVMVALMKQMQGGASKAMGFGKSKVKLASDTGPKVTFNDVAGIEEAKEEMQEIVDFLKDPGRFQRLGGKIPKGCLMIGPPGTGKTLMAKAIAGEANVPFFSTSGSDFVEMVVGVGASRVREMFDQGKRNAPCIIFIDEIDAVGRQRGVSMGGGNDEREQTLNQMLVEMDGFEANEGVIIIAATNRPDILDKALLRPGRFDRSITVDRPSLEGRESILKVHLGKVKYAKDLNARQIAKGTPGFTGADLANLVNESALLAARRKRRFIGQAEIEEAKDKVMMGPTKRGLSMTEEDKQRIAYHEAGHAIVGINTEASDPIHKATIVPRGMALGMVMPIPENDRVSQSVIQLKSDIAMSMGGRVSEELIFGFKKTTSGPAHDIQRATKLARAMVRQYGFSDKVGLVDYSGEEQSPEVSESTMTIIDEEVKKLVDEGYNQARRILNDKYDDLVKLAKALMEYETLTGEEIRRLLAGEEIFDQPEDDNTEGHGGSREKDSESADNGSVVEAKETAETKHGEPGSEAENSSEAKTKNASSSKAKSKSQSKSGSSGAKKTNNQTEEQDNNNSGDSENSS